MKKFWLLLALAIVFVFSCVALVACDTADEKALKRTYAMYVAYAEENGEEVLTYEQWLETIRGPQGPEGPKGDKGDKGDDGKDGADGTDGVGIAKVEKTSTDGLVDTYTITFTDGKTTTFTITNGANGTDGKDGIDGQTPHIGEDGYWYIGDTKTDVLVQGSNGKDGVDGTDGQDGEDGKDGVNGADGKDGVDGTDGIGIAKVEKTSTDGLVDTYTITFTDGKTTTFTITNGANGTDGTDGKDGVDGVDGKDGVDGVGIQSVTISQSGKLLIIYTDGTSNEVSFSQCSHQFSEWTVEQAPTCISTGSQKRVCSFCGFVELVSIPATKHTLTTYSSKDDDYHYSFCSVCNGYVREKHIFSNNNSCECGQTLHVSEGLKYALNDDGVSYSITGIGTCADTQVVIPSTYESFPVTAIADNAFDGCKSIERVIIPNSVISIGASAFADCSKLNEINIPDGVKIIGANTFNYSGLTTIKIPASVMSIGEAAFCLCSELESIKVEQGNTIYSSEGDCLIELKTKTLLTGCKNSVIPTDGSVTKIGFAAFGNCKGLTTLTIPNHITSLGDGAFVDCENLEKISIPSCVTMIGFATFMDCYKLVQVDLPTDLTDIGQWAFQGCTSLKSIDIPDSVTTIGEMAFWYCIVLENVNISENSQLTHLGNDAFGHCESLTDIYIPQKVISIDGTLIRLGRNIESIAVAAGNTVYHSEGNCLIETASGKLIAGCKNSVIPSDGTVTTIGSYSFQGITDLTSMTIPSGVITIEDSAFSDCTDLINVIIYESVTSIGEGTFRGCSSLTSVLFSGTANQWSSINVGSSNDPLAIATIYYHSATEPTVDGNYWHYVDGVPTVWVKEN